MFKKALHISKRILQMLTVMVLGFSISLAIRMSVDQSLRFPADNEIFRLDSVSKNLDHKEKSVVTDSRESILYILSKETKHSSNFSSMSGTYVTYNDRFFVITAAHGVGDDCSNFFVVSSSKDELYDCIQYVIVDQKIDYAIIEIEKVNNRIPVRLKEVLPKNREWKQETAALNEVFYTGYPNGVGPLTFRGSIAGLSSSKYIYLHSYAWPGSSGSGVFSYNGNMIGIVIALSVGFTAAGYDVLEDLVIVTPLFMIDWDKAYEVMNEPPPEGDIGDTGQ